MKKPTPAQLAARARFAEMARSGAFKKKAASKRKKNPAGVSEAKTVRELKTVKQMREWFGSLTDALTDAEVQYMKSQFITLGYGDFVPGQIPANVFYRAQIDATRLHPTVKRKANPAKKTVSQKISQLTREGYPQKQAVAIALSEERAGKVKRNPVDAVTVDLTDQRYGETRVFNTEFMVYKGDIDPGYFVYGREKNGVIKVVAYPAGPRVKRPKISRLVQPGFKTKAEAMRVAEMLALEHGVGLKKNPATGEKRSRTKLNPMAAPARSASESNYKYSVEAKRLIPGGSVFEPLAGFHTKAQAQDYAKAILASHPGVTLRIKTYS